MTRGGPIDGCRATVIGVALTVPDVMGVAGE